MNEEKVYTFYDESNNPYFVKESELTKEHIGHHIRKIVEVYNNAPLQARDHFTRGLISTLGITEELLHAMGLSISLSPPDNNNGDTGNQSPSGLIIQS